MKPPNSSSSQRVLPWILALVPFVYVVFAIARYRVDVPFWDDWELVPFLEKYYQGTLSLSDLWSQHSEHRIFFPRIIMIALARLTGWDISYELAVNVLLGAAIFWVFVYQLKSTASSAGVSGWQWVVPLISLIVFSLMQWENWLWGWQMQVFLNVFAVVAGIVMLSSPVFRWPRFVGALIMGIVATYSFANGAAYWLIGLLTLLFLLPGSPVQRRVFRLALSVWTVVGCLTIFLYLHGYQKPSYHPSVWVAVHQPLLFLRYEVTYLFAPVAPNAFTFLLTCPALVASCYFGRLLFRARQIQFQVLIPYIAMSLYVIASALVTGVGRVGLGSGQAGQSRYVTISSMLWISAVIVLWLFIARWKELQMEPRKKNILRIIALYSILSIAYLGALRSAYSLDFAAFKYKYLSAARNELLSGKDIDHLDEDLLRHLYPWPDSLRTKLRIIQKYHLSIYRESSP